MRKRTLFATPRCVNGIPNSAAIPEAAVMPANELKIISGHQWRGNKSDNTKFKSFQIKSYGHTGNHFHLNALLLQIVHLFPTPSKYLNTTFTLLITDSYIICLKILENGFNRLTKGSPPLSLTTFAPASAKLKSNS